VGHVQDIATSFIDFPSARVGRPHAAEESEFLRVLLAPIIDERPAASLGYLGGNVSFAFKDIWIARINSEAAELFNR